MSSEYDYVEDSGEDLGEIEEEFGDENPEIPDVLWKEDIENIENPVLQEKEIEAAEKLLEKERELLAKAESGKIDQIEFEEEYFHKLGPQKSSAATRSGLESEGITWDHLGDLAEDYDIIVSGNTETMDKKVHVKEVIRELGPEASQELADRMYDEEELSEKTHESISRQVRLQKLDP